MAINFWSMGWSSCAELFKRISYNAEASLTQLHACWILFFVCINTWTDCKLQNITIFEVNLILFFPLKKFRTRCVNNRFNMDQQIIFFSSKKNILFPFPALLNLKIRLKTKTLTEFSERSPSLPKKEIKKKAFIT